MTDIRQVRRLTQTGIDLLWKHIDGCREDEARGLPTRQLPPTLLDGTTETEALSSSPNIDRALRFPTRFEFGKYIVGQGGLAWVDTVSEDTGLWAWLALAYWDQFTEYGVSRQEHYIPAIGVLAERFGYQRVDYRHCTRTPVLLFRRLGEEAKLFLAGSARKHRPMSEMGDFVEQTLSRQDIYGNPRFLEVLRKLYADDNGFEKVGSTAAPKWKKLRNGQWSKSGRGGVRRLVTGVLPRLKLTYNVDGLGADNIIALAGPEFSSVGA